MLAEQPRKVLEEWALARHGALYLWNGDGEELPAETWERLGLPLPEREQRETFDCSGFVTCGMRAIGLPNWTKTRNSKLLFKLLQPTDKPESMDLAFWGYPEIEHVMFFMRDGRVYGACGGGRKTVTPEIAVRKGASVRFRASHMYRNHFRGFRRLPLHT